MKRTRQQKPEVSPAIVALERTAAFYAQTAQQRRRATIKLLQLKAKQ